MMILSFIYAIFLLLAQQPHDFYVKNSYYTSWVSPVRDAGFGKNVFIEVEDSIFHLDSMAFQHKIEKLNVKKTYETYTLYSAHFNFKREKIRFLGDYSPDKKQDSIAELLFSKWSLEENEALLFYTYNQKAYTYKLTLTEKKKDSLVTPM